MLRRKKFYVIYPEYFDSKVSRKQGRRLSLKDADDTISLNKIGHVCKKLNIPHQLQPDKSFPSTWWEKSGRVLITIDKKNKIPKQQLIRQIGAETKKLIVKKKEKKVKVEVKSKYTQKSTHSKKRSTYQAKKIKKRRDK